MQRKEAISRVARSMFGKKEAMIRTPLLVQDDQHHDRNDNFKEMVILSSMRSIFE
ncbi:hypothetical protein GCM10027286_08910 [Virgibacillus ainsalahensis]